ncbi:hypothetical protein SHALO_0154 [Sulfurospirillum halorespirans DSM 13726]|jgi:hypothetical protein|uniref:Uncharacterized protein n=2 Tax=Sulfurospirillum halorespirans TaxID=194424 RepID=A0A1D7TG31_9BACT|nr:hypothetical protein SHALO_0154 [Sulfurospirillum halorespirans DSM 13726]
MKMLKMSLVSILLVLGVTTNSYAWGDREQGVLLGAGAAVLLGGIINAAQQPTRYVESPVVYYEPRPTVVYREPVYVQERVIYVDPPRYYYPPRHHHDRYDRYDRYYR